MYRYHAVHSLVKLFYVNREDNRSRRQLTPEMDLLLVRISELQCDEAGKQFATLLVYCWWQHFWLLYMSNFDRAELQCTF